MRKERNTTYKNVPVDNAVKLRKFYYNSQIYKRNK